LLVVLPWTVRNYAVTGLLIPVTGGVLGGPALFYISTRSDLDQRDETTLWPALGRDPVFAGQTGNARERQLYASRFLTAGLDNITHDPLAYLGSRLMAYPQLWVTSGDFIAGADSATFARSVQQRDWASLARKGIFLAVFSMGPLVLAIVGLLSTRAWSP